MDDTFVRSTQYPCQLIFYPSINAYRNNTPAVISSSPAFTQQTADDDAAAKAIASIETGHHIGLNDFNYYSKESAIDKNRSLINKGNMLVAIIKTASN
ncbi:hypothetical protein EJB05_56017, partial [Eragrostis curvula]